MFADSKTIYFLQFQKQFILVKAFSNFEVITKILEGRQICLNSAQNRLRKHNFKCKLKCTEDRRWHL